MAKREPSYCRHKATNQAYVRLNGQTIYLGEYDSPKSHKRYSRLKAEWLTNPQSPKLKPKSQVGPFMADLSLAYLDYAEKYYPHGSEYANLELAIKPIDELYSEMRCDEFGIAEYKTCRQWWVDRGVSRQYANKQTKRLLRIIKWGVENSMVPPSTVEALRCVAPLKRGRCEAPESKKILPVDEKLVEATLPHCTQVLRDMITLQRLVGCRPGELVCINPGMVDRTGDVWLIRLDHHKTAHHGHERTIYVGPKAQAILAKYFLRAPDTPCFSPRESERQRLDAKHAARVTPMSCGNVPGSNRTRKPQKTPGEAFTSGTYARAIRNATKRAKIKPWAPNQLRHSAGTELRKRYGLDGAQVILGHASANITQTYAELDAQKAVAIAREVG